LKSNSKKNLSRLHRDSGRRNKVTKKQTRLNSCQRDGVRVDYATNRRWPVCVAAGSYQNRWACVNGMISDHFHSILLDQLEGRFFLGKNKM